jgi:hypothetical protein
MYEFDHFEAGLPDHHSDYPVKIAECAYVRCGIPIYAGEKNWDFDGEWFCSAVCIVKYLGAEKRNAE